MKLAPEEDVIALSLRGKLAAQAGKRQEAAKWFAAMVREIPATKDTARSDYEYAQNNEARPLTTGNFERSAGIICWLIEGPHNWP